MPTEADDSDFFRKFEESLEKESGCFDLLQNFTDSHTVVQSLLERSVSQSVTRSSPVNWTVFYEKYCTNCNEYYTLILFYILYTMSEFEISVKRYTVYLDVIKITVACFTYTPTLPDLNFYCWMITERHTSVQG